MSRECQGGARVPVPGPAGLAALVPPFGRGRVLRSSLALPGRRCSPPVTPGGTRDPPTCPTGPPVPSARQRVVTSPNFPGVPEHLNVPPDTRNWTGGGHRPTRRWHREGPSPPVLQTPVPPGPRGSRPVPGTCSSEQGSGAAEQAERAPGHPARCRCRCCRLYFPRGRRGRPRPRRRLSVPGGTAASGPCGHREDAPQKKFPHLRSVCPACLPPPAP